MKMGLANGLRVTLILLLTTSAAWAQATAQMSGTVRDESGGVLPGAPTAATPAGGVQRLDRSARRVLHRPGLAPSGAEARPAPARVLGVRVLEAEPALPELPLDVVDLHAEQIHRAHRVDEALHALDLEHHVAGALVLFDVQAVLEARAASADHGDAQYPDVKSCWDAYGLSYYMAFWFDAYGVQHVGGAADWPWPQAADHMGWALQVWLM